ncbi:Clp protease N-terminal domain-containing protein [Kitasatospora sp. NPDC059571]|uniref:Clp protease N-terminal domain-containing protein n=1 Tax=Kitasatospora sp. NPDC059571 TaxID=3346871 RepID=UPI0036CD6077
MFERFTSDSRTVVRRAQDEARRLHHPFLGTEHLLIGLADPGSGAAYAALHGHGLDPADLRRRISAALDPGLDDAALAAVGIDLARVREAVEAGFGPGALDARTPGQPKTGHIPLTRRAKKVLELSLREALRLGHRSIGSGHILLGLLREGEGLGHRVLVEAGADEARLRTEVERLLAAEAA